MKRVFLATTALVVSGGMAAADVAVTGSAELGVSGKKGADAKLHKDIDVNFSLSGATDAGLSFGASIDLDEAAAENDDGMSTYDNNGHVFISGAFGTLTLGDTDGAFDAALTEVGSGGAIADDHTSHPGYNGNGGLKGFANNGGHGLRYDYTLGGVTTSVSGEFDTADSSNSALGVGVKWSGDVGGIGMGFGFGYQSGSKTEAIGYTAAADPVPATCLEADGTTVSASGETNVLECADNETKIADGTAAVARVLPQAGKDSANIIGMSASADMGNGFSVVANISSKSHDTMKGIADLAGAAGTHNISDANGIDTKDKVMHTAIGVAYSVGDLTVAVNAGRSTTKRTMLSDRETSGTYASVTDEYKASGAGLSVVYSLGTGVNFQVGVGAGKADNMKTKVKNEKMSSWSAGLAFSF